MFLSRIEEGFLDGKGAEVLGKIPMSFTIALHAKVGLNLPSTINSMMGSL